VYSLIEPNDRHRAAQLQIVCRVERSSYHGIAKPRRCGAPSGAPAHGTMSNP
jgi:hypothetical protein